MSPAMHKQHGSEISSPPAFVLDERFRVTAPVGATSQPGVVNTAIVSGTRGNQRVATVGP